MYLPDINVWLALTFEAHSHHPQAKSWFEAIQDDIIMFCRVTQLGFLRLATNPAVFTEEALTSQDAWDCFDRFCEDSRIEFTLEPIGLEHFFRRYTSESSYSPKVWKDAYLAAFAVTSGTRLVSFDKAFQRYEELDCVVLSGT
ncbi:MAG: PIN domain-containing protein [Spirochaetaceae bacterium]|nr:MAG: PIN domain-containing protein [Spirochaetaceae bacterium]